MKSFKVLAILATLLAVITNGSQANQDLEKKAYDSVMKYFNHQEKRQQNDITQYLPEEIMPLIPLLRERFYGRRKALPRVGH